MVGDVLRHRLHPDQLLAAHEAIQQLSVVDHLVVATHLGVLVVERIEAVRTGDDDLLLRLLDTLEYRIQGFDVLHRQLLEQEFVARAASRITGAGFLRTQHHELHARGGQQLRDRLGGLLRAILVGTGAADPEQVFVALESFRILTEYRNIEVQLGHPVQAILGILTPGIALVLQILEQTGQLGRELRFDQHLITAHIDDVVDMLDIHRALLDTRTTAGARPQHLGIDHTTQAVAVAGAADQRALGLGAGRLGDLRERALVRLALGIDQAVLVATHILAATGQQIRRLGRTVVAQRHDQQLRRQRLTGVPGRALALAATTFGAGGEVQPALPGEVLDPAGTQGVGVGIDVLHIQGAPLGHHRLGRTQGDTTVVLTLEVDVEEGREPVPRHTPGDVAPDEVQERHTGHQLDEGEDRHHGRVRGQQLGYLHGEEVGGGVALAVQRDLAGLDEDHAEALEQDDRLDHVGGAELRTAEAGESLRNPGMVELANRDQHQNADDGADTHQLVPEVVNTPVADDRPVEFGIERLPVRLEPQDGSGDEADHHQPVGPADGAEFVHARMRDELDQHRLQAR